MAATAPINPPFRADVVGSLLRPPEIHKGRDDLQAGRISAAELRVIEDKAIRDIVALQEKVGLKVVTDGEFRRRNYYVDFYERGLGGVTVDLRGAKGWDYTDKTGHKVQASLPLVNGPLKWTRPIHAEEFRLLAGMTRVMPKITIPSPVVLHYFGGMGQIQYEPYQNLDRFWADVVDAFHKELQTLYDAGCRYVQMDETSVAKFGDPAIQASLKKRGDDWQDLLKVYTEVINRSLSEVPADMHVAMHSCRGNSAGHWQASGGYDLVAETLFNKINVQSYFLEYDSPRAGDFTPLRFVPKNKTIVLGLISSKDAELEPVDAVVRRVEDATKYVPLEQLAVSPQCGFASSTPGNKVTYDEQTAKLQRVVEVARKIWG